MTLKNVLAESRTQKAVQDAIAFLETSSQDSKVLRGTVTLLETIYPQSLYAKVDAFNKKHDSILANNFASPVVIFPVIYLLFISISNYRISNVALATVGVGLLSFYAGFRSVRSGIKEVKLNEKTKEIGILLFAVGLLFLIADLFSAGGLPLFFPSARSRLVVTYTMIAQLIPPGGILLIAFFGERYRNGAIKLKRARIYSFIVLGASLVLIATLGFRTQIIVTLLGGFIAMYLSRVVGFTEGAMSLGVAAAGIVFLGYMRAVFEGSPIGLFDVIGARVGLTLGVFDYLVKRFMPFGANKGYTLLASFSSLIPGLPGPKIGPRTIVARLFGITGISITSTLLGTIVLDFGIVGVVLFMFVLGHVLGTGYRAAKTGLAMGVGIYSVLFAYSIVGIETGLVDFNVLMMFFFGYLLLRSSMEK